MDDEDGQPGAGSGARTPTWFPEDASEETLAKWVDCLAGLPQHLDLAMRRMDLEARLEQLRRERVDKGRDPTIMLLRAQRLTRKRERQCEAAAAHADALRQELEGVQARHDEAVLAIRRSRAALEEAGAHEEELRRGLVPGTGPGTDAGIPAGPVEASLQDLMGLKAQLEALPAAMRAGNMDLAHGAVLQQTASIIERVAAAVGADAPADGEPPRYEGLRSAAATPGAMAGSCGGGMGAQAEATPPAHAPSTPQAPAGRAESPSDWPAAPFSEGATSRSRSRGSEAGSATEDEPAALRRAARAPGQTRLNWAPRSAEQRR